MKHTALFLTAIFSFTAFLNGFSQSRNECIAELMSYDAMAKPGNDSLSEAKNIFLSYTIRATDWDNETTVSNVKMYRQGRQLNLFSEQANIYMDEEEVLIIMPEQKIMIINSNSKNNKSSLGDNFFEMRELFMDSCEVVKCEQKTPDYKMLALKSKRNGSDLFSIESMTYEYNPTERKLISVKVNYKNDYKIKQMTMIYRDYNAASSYKFPAVKKQYAAKRGSVNDNYKDFEIIDNRDKKGS